MPPNKTYKIIMSCVPHSWKLKTTVLAPGPRPAALLGYTKLMEPKYGHYIPRCVTVNRGVDTWKFIAYINKKNKNIQIYKK